MAKKKQLFGIDTPSAVAESASMKDTRTPKSRKRKEIVLDAIITSAVTQETKDILTTIAEKDDRTLSKLVSKILTQYAEDSRK